MKNTMLDLETYGERPGCVILSIGAVLFDPDAGVLGEEFYTAVSLSSCLDHGLHLDPDTVKWWQRQSEEARQVITDAQAPTALSLPLACQAFSGWLDLHSVARDDRSVWGNGASFDQPILTEAYRVCGVERPWMFWNDECYRTIKKRRPLIKMEKSGVQHNALADAKQQALHLIKLLQDIK